MRVRTGSRTARHDVPVVINCGMSRLAHVAICPNIQHVDLFVKHAMHDFRVQRMILKHLMLFVSIENSPSQGRIEIKVFIDMPRQRGIRKQCASQIAGGSHYFLILNPSPTISVATPD